MTWMKKRIGSILFILALCLATMLTVAWADESDLTYNGSAQSPTIEVKLSETTLVKDTDFTVTGNTQTNAVTYELTVTGKGNYKGNHNYHKGCYNHCSTGYNCGSYYNYKIGCWQ